jgi:hypothetical protein
VNQRKRPATARQHKRAPRQQLHQQKRHRQEDEEVEAVDEGHQEEEEGAREEFRVTTVEMPHILEDPYEWYRLSKATRTA